MNFHFSFVWNCIYSKLILVVKMSTQLKFQVQLTQTRAASSRKNTLTFEVMWYSLTDHHKVSLPRRYHDTLWSVDYVKTHNWHLTAHHIASQFISIFCLVINKNFEYNCQKLGKTMVPVHASIDLATFMLANCICGLTENTSWILK